jgi:hypothetical protein
MDQQATKGATQSVPMDTLRMRLAIRAGVSAAVEVGIYHAPRLGEKRPGFVI